LGQRQAENGGWGIASDGIHLWVTDFESDKVVRLARDGGSHVYPVGDSPVGVLFDGTSIWVANFGSDTVTKITLNQP
jgi:DNA-binding beta-propeller fold protein YncE